MRFPPWGQGVGTTEGSAPLRMALRRAGLCGAPAVRAGGDGTSVLSPPPPAALRVIGSRRVCSKLSRHEETLLLTLVLTQRRWGAKDTGDVRGVPGEQRG